MRLNKRKTTRALFLLALIAGSVALWWRAMNIDPIVHIPARVMPKPNAYDLCLAAAKAIVDENFSGPNVTFAQKQAAVQRDAEALRLFKQTFNYPFLSPPMRSAIFDFPVYSKFRTLARLTVAAGQVKAAEGKWGEAATRYLDAIRLGTRVLRGGVVLSALVGVACEAIGDSELWKSVDHLNAGEAKRAAASLEQIEANRVSYVSILKEEKSFGEASFLELFRRPHWRKEFWDSSDPDQPSPGWGAKLKLWSRSKRTIMNEFANYMDAAITNVKRPYINRLRTLPAPSDPVSRELFYATEVSFSACFPYVRRQTQNTLLFASLGLRAYRLEHGEYPDNLTALVPVYLRKVPLDPFADNQPLRYKKLKDKYLLYSIGPDGKDDGGKPIENPKKWIRLRHLVYPNSVGDIVAGVNTP